MRILTHIVTAQEDGATVKHLLRQRFALSSSLLKSIKWREGGNNPQRCTGHRNRPLPCRRSACGRCIRFAQSKPQPAPDRFSSLHPMGG